MTETSARTDSPDPGRQDPRRRGPRWVEILVAAVLAAILASIGTYAVVTATDDGTGTGTAATSRGDADEPTRDVAVAPGGGPDWTAIAAEAAPSVVSINVAGQMGQGSGSGVVWDEQGHIVTNAHVVEGGQQVQVVLADGRRYDADLVGSDPSSDLAVLTLADAPDDLVPITVGDDQALQVGDAVMAVGNPLGLSGTVTQGIVSALDRPVTTEVVGQGDGRGAVSQVPVVTNAIQTSAPINPGNSGGALVDASGQLVGVNSSIAALPGQSQAGSIGIGFAIPTTKVQLIADQLIETGTAEHAFLGVNLNDGAADAGAATLTGAQVVSVESGSPADEAGLQEGDLIISIDDEHVGSAIALVGQIRERASGEEAELEFVRDGEVQTATVTLATRPDDL